MRSYFKNINSVWQQNEYLFVEIPSAWDQEAIQVQFS